MRQYRKIVGVMLAVFVMALGFVPQAKAMTPTLSLVSKADGDQVEITVNGDANASVIFFYTKKDYGSQIVSLGTTSSSGSLVTTISSSSYGIVGNSSVYVATGGVNGSKSAATTWPNLNTAGNFSLNQTGLALTLNQTSSITAYNAGGNAIYVASNSNPPVANINISGNQISVTAIGYGSTVVSVCLVGNTSTCASFYVTVQNGTAQALTFSVNNLTVTPGQSVPVTISGGTGTYTVLNNSNSSVIQTSINGSVITLSTTATSGSSAITVCSSNMNSCGIINATAGSTSTTPLTFSQNNPSLSVGQSLTVGLSGGSSSTYYISNNSYPTVVNAVISNSNLVITANSTGSSTITVCSSSGACGSLIVTVAYTSNGGTLQLSQTSISLLVGQVLSVTVSGGTSPYFLGSNSGAIFQGSLNGNILSISGIAAGAADLNVCSSGGACVSLSVVVNSSGTATPISFSQNNLSLNTGAVSAVTITGAGGYYVSSSSNTNVATAQINGNTILVSALAVGNTNISICQSGGQCSILFVTVSAGASGVSVPTFIPTSPSVGVGQTLSVTISGGTSSSYYISANTNPAAAALSISGSTLTVSGLSVGSTVAVVCASSNSCAPVTISVSSASTAATLTINPSNKTLNVGDNFNASLSGAGGYSVYSNSNNTVASTQISGSTLGIKALSAGSSTITVCQSGGQCSSLSLIVNAASSGNQNNSGSQNSSGVPSGTLVNDKGTIYLVVNNLKYPFASMKAFTGLGYSLANVIKADISGMALGIVVLNSPTQIHPDGSWIVSGKVVFYVSSAGYVPVPTWDIFLKNGGQAKFIVKANAADIADSRPILPKMTENDSRIIK
ncbi:MAG: hypothetical protein HY918_01725 [Candidatus Doudnabacteria bacterium]|nr:hypothetical protein [Candidatus Doudnabacteria bacterium]